MITLRELQLRISHFDPKAPLLMAINFNITKKTTVMRINEIAISQNSFTGSAINFDSNGYIMLMGEKPDPKRIMTIEMFSNMLKENLKMILIS